MKTITKHIHAIRRSPFKFTPYQLDMAEKIFTLLTEKNYKELGNLVNTIKSREDYEFIHYAFYYRFEFGWLSWIQKTCSDDQCVKYGLYNYNF